jgi:tRNA nucleotidyltransferase (CCA-adding enzyme)
MSRGAITSSWGTTELGAVAPQARDQDPAPPFRSDAEALAALRRLWRAGFAAYLVGGAVRDGLLGRDSDNADLTTAARPEEVMGLFPGGRNQNRFGTVVVGPIEITTFRTDRNYGDHRRPDEVIFSNSIHEDLARRDFTVNAIAWGREGDPDGSGHSPERSTAPRGSAAAPTRDSGPDFVDPAGGRADLDARILRAVGEPNTRFEEDALRLLRAARFAAQVGLTIERETLQAMKARAADARFLSGERVGMELGRLLKADRPSVGLRILADTGILDAILPELAGQRGIPQSKIPGHDLWDHTLATVDAAVTLRPGDEQLAMAALLHDAGKPETFSGGHFRGHPEAGATIAREVLGRIAYPSRDSAHIRRLIEEHMFQYLPGWSDAAVRRFMRRVGPEIVDDLLRLRQADNLGSGLAPDAGDLAELRDRVAAERDRGAPLSLGDLAIDGDDLQAEVGVTPGPWLGVLLGRLLDSVVSDPKRNSRQRLLADARRWHADAGTDAATRSGRRP